MCRITYKAYGLSIASISKFGTSNLSNKKKKIQVIAIFFAMVVVVTSSVQLRAETLYNSILYLSKNQKQILAAQADVDAANANNAAKAQAQAVVDNAAKNMALKAKGAAFQDLALSPQPFRFDIHFQ